MGGYGCLRDCPRRRPGVTWRGGRGSYAVARGMLKAAIARGARIFEAEAISFDAAARSVGIQLKNGRQIEARSAVLATGYVMPAIVHSTIQTVSSSWAIATTPQPRNIWKGGALIWEDSKDYLYARTTSAGRIIIGGEDSDQIIEPDCARSHIAAEGTCAGTKARRALCLAVEKSNSAGPEHSILPARSYP